MEGAEMAYLDLIGNLFGFQIEGKTTKECYTCFIFKSPD